MPGARQRMTLTPHAGRKPVDDSDPHMPGQEASLPKRSWEETPHAFATRLRQCCAQITGEFDVEGLCHAFPARIQKLKDAKGERLKE